MNIYHRKDRRWEGRVSRGKKKNGKRRFQYILARTKEDVVEKIKEICLKEQPNESCCKELSVVYNEWYKSMNHCVKESTAANYKMKAEKHILPHFGQIPIDSIVQDDIYEFIEDRRKNDLSDRYISDIIILMKDIFKYAVKTYRIFNPMDGIVLPKKKTLTFSFGIRQNKANFRSILPKIRTLGHLERHFLILQVFVLGSFAHYSGKTLTFRNYRNSIMDNNFF